MKAMILKAPGPIESSPLSIVDMDLPGPGPGQILIKVSSCGVCHTDLHTAEGDLNLPVLPIIPGHQVVGFVAENGSGSGRYETGERVGVAWLNRACGDCVYCKNGQENLCEKALFTGLHSHGGYAEFMVVDERFAYPIPDIFSDLEAAPLLCAGVIGYRSLRLSEIQAGGRLGLYGFGASAHIVIQIARHWHCEVYVFTRGAQHRRLAEDLGAVWTGTVEDKPPCQMDSSISFAPAGKIIPPALKNLRPGGTLAINAIYLSPIPQLDYSFLYMERTLRSVAHVSRRDAEEFLPLAAQIPIRCKVERCYLRDANEVLGRLKNSAIQGSAVLVVQ